MMDRRRVQKINARCPFCEQETEPDYKDYKTIKSLMTEKGKLLNRSRSGVCMRHQRHLAKATKRARRMALVPYVSVIH